MTFLHLKLGLSSFHRKICPKGSKSFQSRSLFFMCCLWHLSTMFLGFSRGDVFTLSRKGRENSIIIIKVGIGELSGEQVWKFKWWFAVKSLWWINIYAFLERFKSLWKHNSEYNSDLTASRFLNSTKSDFLFRREKLKVFGMEI